MTTCTPLLVAFVTLLSVCGLSNAQVDTETLGVVYPARTLQVNNQTCPPDEERQQLQQVTDAEISTLLQDILDTVAPCDGTNLGLEERCPARSCQDIFENSRAYRPTGRYWLINTDGAVIPVYCDMTRECCGTVGGWTLVGYVDMRISNNSCPPGWNNHTTSGKRTCGTSSGTSVTVTFATHSLEYNHVCGKVIAYQYGDPDAFYNSNTASPYDLDGLYLDGVSITYGLSGNRKHIWSFAAARGEGYDDTTICPCTHTGNPVASSISTPNEVGDDYFCETGAMLSASPSVFYDEDPLWDGVRCGPGSTCCHFNNPPWFCKELPNTVTDDIEVRILVDKETSEDIRVEQIEIYIQ